MTAPDAVIFDLDGVLVDTVPLHFQALNLALAECGYRQLTPTEHHALDGLPTTRKLELLGVTDPGVWEAKQRHTADLIRSLPVDATKAELVDDLRAAGWRIGVASNAVRDTVTACLDHLGIAPDVVVANEDAAPKPAPDLYLLACERLGVDTARAVVVEDKDLGVQAALAAGCMVVQTNQGEVDVEHLGSDGWPWSAIQGCRVHGSETVGGGERQAAG